jgi:predicted NUDIX family NTP pyrophosphohydrolase
MLVKYRGMLEKFSETQKYSDQWFNKLYLKYGSVEEAVRSYEENLPISVANYHRLVKKYGLVKSAGRHVSFPETLHFFRLKAMEPGTPLERLYQSMPPSFQTSLSTLHRIYQLMEKQVVRRFAAALIVTEGEKSDSVLIGKELFGNSRYGKKVGDISIPMGFSKKDESDFDSALRVLQQEVFMESASHGQLKSEGEIVQRILSSEIKPFAYFDIVDVRVKVFEISLPYRLSEFSSYKLTEHRFENIENLSKENLRAGVSEILTIYGDYLYKPYILEPSHYVSDFNATVVAPSLISA